MGVIILFLLMVVLGSLAFAGLSLFIALVMVRQARAIVRERRRVEYDFVPVPTARERVEEALSRKVTAHADAALLIDCDPAHQVDFIFTSTDGARSKANLN